MQEVEVVGATVFKLKVSTDTNQVSHLNIPVVTSQQSEGV